MLPASDVSVRAPAAVWEIAPGTAVQPGLHSGPPGPKGGKPHSPMSAPLPPPQSTYMFSMSWVPVCVIVPARLVGVPTGTVCAGLSAGGAGTSATSTLKVSTASSPLASDAVRRTE